MKAQKIYEKLGFERRQDPKAAMEIGQAKDKKKLIALMADPGNFPSSEDAKAKFEYMKKVIMEPTTKVRFEKKHESTPGDGRIVITLPPSPVNVFFFESLKENVGRNNDVESYPWDEYLDKFMKASKVYERMDFERGIDPKKSMDIGLEHKFGRMFNLFVICHNLAMNYETFAWVTRKQKKKLLSEFEHEYINKIKL
jgi:hypothetical protein